MQSEDRGVSRFACIILVIRITARQPSAEHATRSTGDVDTALSLQRQDLAIRVDPRATSHLRRRIIHQRSRTVGQNEMGLDSRKVERELARSTDREFSRDTVRATPSRRFEVQST